MYPQRIPGVKKGKRMSQRQVKKTRKEFKRLFDNMLDQVGREPFRDRLRLAWSVLLKKNYFITKAKRRNV